MVLKRTAAEKLKHHAEAAKKARTALFAQPASESVASASTDPQALAPRGDGKAQLTYVAMGRTQTYVTSAELLGGDSSRISTASVGSVAAGEIAAVACGVEQTTREHHETVNLERELENMLDAEAYDDCASVAAKAYVANEVWRFCMGMLPTATAMPSVTATPPATTWMDKLMDGWLGGWVDGWMDGCMHGRTDGRTDGRSDGWTERRMDG